MTVEDYGKSVDMQSLSLKNVVKINDVLLLFVL